VSFSFRLGNTDPSLSRIKPKEKIKPKLFFVVEGAETERIYVQEFKNAFEKKILGDVICLDRIDKHRSNQLYIVTLIDTYFKSLSSLDNEIIQRINCLRDEILVEDIITDDFLNEKLSKIKSLIDGEIYQDLFGKVNLEDGSDPLEVLNAFVELQNFSKGFDQILILIDRDKQSFKVSQYEKVMDISEKQGYKLGISNPCFELFLFLHLNDIKGLNKKKLRANSPVKDDLRYTAHVLKEELKKYSKSFRSKSDYDANFIVSKFHNLDKNIKVSKIATDPKELKDKMGTSVYEIIKPYL
jgi:hypothetical protein